MHFSKNERSGKKVVKACAVLLSLFMLCTMLYVGTPADLGADALTFSRSIYFNFSEGNDSEPQWIKDDARPAIWWWNDVAPGRFSYLDVYDIDNGIFVFYVPQGEDCKYFKLLRMDPSSSYTKTSVYPQSSDGLWNETDTINVPNDRNYLYARIGNQSWSTIHFDPGSGAAQFKGNTEMEASSQGLKNGSFKTGYGVGNTEIIPVDAVFYDYLTDHELMYGWRSTNDSNQAQVSRTYRNRIPYKGFNAYLSQLAVDNGWNYPLYFGNFTSHWSNLDTADVIYGSYTNSFTRFAYGILKDVDMYKNANTLAFFGSDQNDAQTFLRRELLTSSYTYGDGLEHFSIFANDSEALTEMTGTYSGSVQGLVESSLTGSANDDARSRQLQMKGGLISPYFAGANEYTNTVSTQFPMRVERGNTTTVRDDYTGNDVNVKYTTYEFDAKGKNDNGNPDIVYFSYGRDGRTTAINYTQDKNKQVIDAYKSLGGRDDYHNGENHRGFFPFDEGNGSGTKIGLDYGFGMRLDIDFNLTKDGNVLGQSDDGTYYETNVPMTFNFEGDDDVWVFVDGKLALDLGGDHGNAAGGINFATGKSYIDTGAVELKASPEYGSTEYSRTLSNSSTSFEEDLNVFSGDDYIGDSYNTKKNHTLTVFYMERGLVESNLKLSFSISPRGNDLSVEKHIDYSNVNSLVRPRVKNYYDNASHTEKFDFEIDDGTGTSKYRMYRIDGENDGYSEYNYNLEEDWNNGVTMDAPRTGERQYADIENQLKDDTDIEITETIHSDCYYDYETSYSVKDEFMEENYNHGFSSDSDYVICDDTDAKSPGTKGGGSVTVPFSTKSNVTSLKKYNEFSVDVTNTIKTADVTFNKTVSNDPASSDSFKFDVYVKLPSDDEMNSGDYFGQDPDPDTEVDIKAGQTKTVLTDIPVGSTVKFVEKLTDQQKNFYIENDANKPLKQRGIDYVVKAANNTATYTNEKKTVNAQVKATKTFDGAPSGQTFAFTLTKLKNGDPTSEILSARNFTDDAATHSKGGIVFELRGLPVQSTIDYIMEETRGNDNTINYSSKKYWVTVDTTSGTADVSYYTVTSNGAKGSPVDPANVVFENTTKPQLGSLTVIKKGSDGASLSGVMIALVKADGNDEPLAGEAPDVRETDGSGIIEYTDLEPGRYVVYETKSKQGYELYGRYYPVTVGANDNVEITITDNTSPKLPESGGIGVVVMILAGLALVGLGVYLLRPSKKESAEKK